MERWHNLAQGQSVGSTAGRGFPGLRRAALCLVLSLGAGGCFGGPHPIPPEVFDPNAQGPDDLGNSGGGGIMTTGGAGGAGGTGGASGFGGAGGLGGSGGFSAQDAGGDPIISTDGGVDASDDDAGSPVGQ